LSWFSKEYLAQTRWTDLNSTTSLHVFSIHGDARMFEISDDYGDCKKDSGWFLITAKDCEWETRLPKASILYSKLDHKVNWNQYGMKITSPSDA